MTQIWLEIQRRSGIDKRLLSAEVGASRALAAGSCPGCGATPFLVFCRGHERIDNETLRGGGVSDCCGENVGYVFARSSTIFGREEDENVLLRGRARVYG